MLFSERVYELVAKIPRARVTTYGEIARALNTRAYRAVGQALKNNKNPFSLSDCSGCNNQTPQLVPCHRVVKSSGELGGFRGRETREKARMLRSEGIEIRGNRIELEKYFYRFYD